LCKCGRKDFLTLAREARERAEEVLTRAETFQDARAKQKMRAIAAEYEKLAERLEGAAAETSGNRLAAWLGQRGCSPPTASDRRAATAELRREPDHPEGRERVVTRQRWAS
jgi:hypothetical protein